MKKADISYQAIPIIQLIAKDSAARRRQQKPRQQIRSAAECTALILREFYAKHAEPERETFVCLMLDAAKKLIGIYPVTTGTLNMALCHPREVFRAALVYPGTGAIVLAHNHPSGDPAPSEEDKSLTKQFVEAGKVVGIPVLDHIIVGEGRHHSFANERQL